MPAQTVQKLDFREKLIQSGKKENTDALLKRLKVGSSSGKRSEGELDAGRSAGQLRGLTLGPRRRRYTGSSACLIKTKKARTSDRSIRSGNRLLTRSSYTTRSERSEPWIVVTSRETLLISMPSRGVRAFAACCLADVLRIYAPDAPYTQEELRVSTDMTLHNTILPTQLALSCFPRRGVARLSASPGNADPRRTSSNSSPSSSPSTSKPLLPMSAPSNPPAPEQTRRASLSRSRNPRRRRHSGSPTFRTTPSISTFSTVSRRSSR
jgi:hypothetical protein